jgi:hypothetical protein
MPRQANWGLHNLALFGQTVDFLGDNANWKWGKINIAFYAYLGIYLFFPLKTGS